MSRALERAKDVVLRIGEMLSIRKIEQLRIEDAPVDHVPVTDGAGGVRLVPASDFGGEGNVPLAPRGEQDALTTDVNGNVQWGGVISAGKF